MSHQVVYFQGGMMKIISAILFLSVFTPALYAEQSMMRLFYTPAERAQIDANRSLANETTKQAKSIVPETANIELKGYMKRSGKPDVVWVNDKNTLKSNKPLSDVKVIKVQKHGKVKLRVNGQGTVKLKPGEILSRGQRKTIEAYEKK